MNTPLDFFVIAAKLRGRVSRRRHTITFLAAVLTLGSIAQVLLKRQFEAAPEIATSINYFSFLLGVLVAIRMAKHHEDITYYGRLYQELLNGQGLPEQANAERARQLWFRGVSFLLFTLSLIVIAISATLAGANGFQPAEYSLAAGGFAILGLYAYLYRCHQRAIREAEGTIARARGHLATWLTSSVSLRDWQEHMLCSIEDTHHDQTAIITFVGLTITSIADEILLASPLADKLDLARLLPSWVHVALCSLLVATCVAGWLACLRLRRCEIKFSKLVDPGDEQTRASILADFRIGNWLMSFLLSAGLFASVFSLGSLRSLSVPKAVASAAAIALAAWVVVVVKEYLLTSKWRRETLRVQQRDNLDLDKPDGSFRSLRSFFDDDAFLR